MTRSALGQGVPAWFGAHLTTSAVEDGPRTALVFEDRAWTYAELDLAVRHLAGTLAATGVGRGDRVVMQGAARPEAVLTMFAVTRLGAVLVPLHPRVAAAELAFVCEEVAPRAVVGDPTFSSTGDRRDLPPSRWLTWDDVAGDDARTGRSADPHWQPPQPRDPAMIAFTSGTSGRPRGVVLTHDNLYWSAVNALSRLPLSQADVTLVATPLAHVAVLGGLPQYTWARRGTVVLAPRFDADLFIDLVRDHDATVAFAVPAMLSLLTRHPRFDSADLNPLRWVLSGGSPAMSDTAIRLLDRGIDVINSYGLTEASAGVTYATADQVRTLPTSAGPPVPHIEMRIVDGRGRAMQAGTVGEIWLRGPSITAAYWTHNRLEAATDDEGWFHTGDRGRLDTEGRLEVVGRVKDTIITGGENVDPAEVEDALTDLPGIREIAVAGTPDPVWGEIVTAFVVADSGSEPTVDDLRHHLAGRLAKHNWPRQVRLVPALPRGTTGKLQRQQLSSLLPADNPSPPAAGKSSATAHTTKE
jgi:fatty-acyl-CoA synthase